MKLIDQNSINWLFLKMSAHFNSQMPTGEVLEFMQQEYYRELNRYPEKLVFDNLIKHIHKSNFIPTVADLIKDDTIYSSVPNVEETRLMIAEREKERENHVPSNPEYVKKLIAETKTKLMEVKLNELERDYKRACELRSRE